MWLPSPSVTIIKPFHNVQGFLWSGSYHPYSFSTNFYPLLPLQPHKVIFSFLKAPAATWFYSRLIWVLMLEWLLLLSVIQLRSSFSSFKVQWKYYFGKIHSSPLLFDISVSHATTELCCKLPYVTCKVLTLFIVMTSPSPACGCPEKRNHMVVLPILGS